MTTNKCRDGDGNSEESSPNHEELSALFPLGFPDSANISEGSDEINVPDVSHDTKKMAMCSVTGCQILPILSPMTGRLRLLLMVFNIETAPHD